MRNSCMLRISCLKYLLEQGLLEPMTFACIRHPLKVTGMRGKRVINPHEV